MQPANLEGGLPGEGKPLHNHKMEGLDSDEHPARASGKKKFRAPSAKKHQWLLANNQLLAGRHSTDPQPQKEPTPSTVTLNTQPPERRSNVFPLSLPFRLWNVMVAGSEQSLLDALHI